MVRYELWSKLNNIYQEVLSELSRLKIIEKKKKKLNNYSYSYRCKMMHQINWMYASRYTI